MNSSLLPSKFSPEHLSLYALRWLLIHKLAFPTGMLFLLVACSSSQQKPPTPIAAPDAASCLSLQTFTHPNTVIHKASIVATGIAKDGVVAMPEHCLVTGEIEPRLGVQGVRYGSKFEIRLPMQWNGRFQFQGGGGVDGVIRPAFGTLRNGVTPALAQGAAVASTDMGHVGSNTRDASFGMDPQARTDWGYGSVDKVTILSKAILTRFYTVGPQYSYFVGCSGGGRQGMIMSQRFAHHFDGVVAGAPILEQHIAQIGSMQILKEFNAIAPIDATGQHILSRAYSDQDLNLIAQGVLAQCDARDGAEDGIIENYAACRYDVSALQCKGEKAANCLSADQVHAMNLVMKGPHNSAGKRLYPPYPWDTGIAGWRANQLGSSTTGTPNSAKFTNQSIRLVFMTPPAPDFNYMSFDFDRDPARLLASAAFSASNSTDYQAFKARKGKTIIYTGWSDSLVNPAGVLHWYEKLVTDQGGLQATQQFARFFNVPGMEHCSGGKALDVFDPVTPLYDWVEKGIAPDQFMAVGKSFPNRQRAICAYPKIARYKGSGSVDFADSFTCAVP
jgi:Tannase and feruloyl esterase